MGGEALHRTQTLARQSQEGWRRGKGRWGAGGRTGKPVCAAGVCGVSPGLLHICPHHAEVQGEGFSLWSSHCWAGSGGWNFPTCISFSFRISSQPWICIPWHTRNSWSLGPGSCRSHHPLAHLKNSSALGVLLFSSYCYIMIPVIACPPISFLSIF